MSEQMNGQPQTMRRSESIAALSAALAKAQGEMSAPKKDKANPYYKHFYTDLAGILEAVRGPLSRNGLAYMQMPRAGDGWIEVETVLSHSSGEWIANTLRLPALMIGKDGKERWDAQAAGSGITYACRYSLAAIVGIAGEDDDANMSVDTQQTSVDNLKELREKGMKKLNDAASDGLADLEACWKLLDNRERQACKSELENLKKTAKIVDEKRNAVKEVQLNASH
jgi:hypothetical protein